MLVIGSVMPLALNDFQPLLGCLARDAIDEPVFLVDPARPKSREFTAQGFRFAGSFERRAAAFVDQAVQAKLHLPVGFAPEAIILPGVGRKDDVHGRRSSRSHPSPRSSCATPSRSRRAFAGLDNRYSVSTIEFHSDSEKIGRAHV